MSTYYKTKNGALRAMKSGKRLEMQHISQDLRDDEEVVSALLTAYPYDLYEASDRLQNDRSFVMSLVCKNPNTLSGAPAKFKDDDELAEIAVTGDPYAFSFLSKRLQNKKELFLLSKINNDTLRTASTHIQDDKECVLHAVTNCGAALRFASRRLQADMEIVQAAVCNEGQALVYASPPLQENKSLILMSLSSKHKNCGLHYLSSGAFNDIELILEAFKNRSIHDLVQKTDVISIPEIQQALQSKNPEQAMTQILESYEANKLKQELKDATPPRVVNDSQKLTTTTKTQKLRI